MDAAYPHSSNNHWTPGLWVPHSPLPDQRLQLRMQPLRLSVLGREPFGDSHQPICSDENRETTTRQRPSLDDARIMAMGAMHNPSLSLFGAFVTVVQQSLRPLARTPIVTRTPILSDTLSRALPAALLPIPSLLGSLWDGSDSEAVWDGILNAVPKKKTSHMKKRHRQMAGKALRDVTALNKCSACGRPKRAHVLCPYCVNSIRRWFGNGFKSQREVEIEEEKMHGVYQQERKIYGLKPLAQPTKSGKA